MQSGKSKHNRMPYNKQFELDSQDIDLIESALRDQMGKDEETDRVIQDLLGRLHNQKQWYRPNDPGYVSG